ESCDYDGMPRSAIATGLVDYVLPPAEMPAQLVAYIRHAFGKKHSQIYVPATKSDDLLKKICILLRDQTGHDFSQYKQNTLIRRIERRMAINQIERWEEYQRYLQKNQTEAEALFRDLLIGVTNFFRDPEAFQVLQEKIIPQLFSGKASGSLVRIWVCGCSTGEEAYSIAILIQEHLESLKKTFKVQIFSTDIDIQAIEQARSGIYPESISADLSMERLSRFFVKDKDCGMYRIQKHIRDLIVFSGQDVIKDPPFSKLDMICCRNLLIYMNGELQKKLIPLFHYSLNREGVLFLGTSETVGQFSTLFDTLDRKWKIYLRKQDYPVNVRTYFSDFIPPLLKSNAYPQLFTDKLNGKDRVNFREILEQELLHHYAQAGILIDSRGEILYIYGRTGKYLEPTPGNVRMNIFSMAREGLRRELTTALHKVVVNKKLIHCQGLKIKTNGESITANMIVRPASVLSLGSVESDLFIIILEECKPSSLELEDISHTDYTNPPVTNAEKRIAELELELRAKDEYLQTTIEEMETSNEELKSTNEEMQSVNEELQSTNEELETSKEELQSVNEELSTVNNELQNKITELSRINNDMNNLLAGIGMATIFVDLQLRINRFTPSATKIINLIQTDIGRPVGHIVSNLSGYNRLIEDAQTVLDTLIPYENEVQSKTGSWYLIRIRPYRTLENVIEGLVITFLDITDRKQLESELRIQKEVLNESK
ncbi:MAG: PAS domain-containing protein, partial [Desulfobacterales bacterium]|nr:PAS domain-containing protein [Desulfobacterales bacterium]